MIETLTPLLTSAFDPAILAQATDLSGQIKEIIKLLRMIAFILSIASLIVGAILFSSGRVEGAVYSVAAAGILSLSGAITKYAFSATGDDFDF